MTKVSVGTLIKEARTKAGFSQAALAEKIDGLSASDISKAERGEKELSQAQLKAIAKATGVTQKSLLEAAAGTASTTTSSSAKTESSTSSGTSGMIKVTATEKKLVELYRAADSDTKKSVMKILKGEKDTGDTSEMVSELLENALGMLLKK